MAAFLLGNLIGTRDCQISSRPETDIVGKRSSRTVHKIRNTLEAGQLHAVSLFLLIFIFQFLSRRVAGKEPFDHELKKSVFRGQLASSAKCDFADLIHRISFRRIGTGEPDTDMIFTEPLILLFVAPL